MKLVSILFAFLLMGACGGPPVESIPPETSARAAVTAPAADQIDGSDRVRSQLDEAGITLEHPESWTTLEKDGGLILGPENVGLRMQTVAVGEGETTLLNRLDEFGGGDGERRYLFRGGGEDGEGQPWGEYIVNADALLAYLPLEDLTTALEISGAASDENRRIVESLEPIGSPPLADVKIEFVEARLVEGGTWTFSVRLRHADLGWHDYADGWQIATPEGEVIATRILLHPHENEQPFTRSLSGVELGETTDRVWIVAHELIEGYSAPISIPLADAVETEHYRVIR